METKEIAKLLKDISDAQHFGLGQTQALQVALGACLRALRAQPELIARIRADLASWQQLNLQHEQSLGIRDGFESMQRQLSTYMGEHPAGPSHTAQPGSMN